MKVPFLFSTSLPYDCKSTVASRVHTFSATATSRLPLKRNVKQEHSVLSDACQPEKGQTKDNSQGCVGEGLASRWANDPKSSEDDDLPLATTPATASRGSAFGSDRSEKDRKDQAMQGRLELVYEV